MGVFSKVHRFHDVGEEPNVNNVSNFGVPAYSLFYAVPFLKKRVSGNNIFGIIIPY